MTDKPHLVGEPRQVVVVRALRELDARQKQNICLSCYWAAPENYQRVGMRRIRRVDLIWQGQETTRYEKLKSDAVKAGLEIPQFVKDVLTKALK